MISTLALAAVVATATATAAAPAAPDRSAPPKPGPVRPFKIEKPQELTLKNGMRVLFLHRTRAPLVDIVATLPAGVAEDPMELPGLAMWTANMLTEGAGDMDSIAFSDAEQAIGAQIFSGAGIDSATAGLHVSSAKLSDGLKLFATALMQPRFDAKEWQRIQHQTFGFFMYQSQEPQQLVELAGGLEDWGKDNRLGVNIMGTPHALVKTTTADMKSFYTAHYRPDTVTLVVVGDVSKSALKKLLEEDFGAWTATGKPPEQKKLAGPVALTKTTVVTVDVKNAPQTVLRVQNPAPPDLKPYTPDVVVMNTLLGGSFTSRLNQNLREQHGYTYGAGSRMILLPYGNVFMARAAVATPVTAPALKEMMGELERIRTPATAEEVDRARTLAALSIPSEFDNGRSTATLWAQIVSEKLDLDRVQKFMDEAPKVDVKQVQAVAGAVVKPDACTIVAVGDMSKVGKDLASFGPVKTLSVDELLPGLKEAMKAFGGPSGE